MFGKSKTGELRQIAKIDMGTSPDSSTYNDRNQGLPFYQGKTEFTDMIIGKTAIYCSQPIKIAQANDVLISVRAPVGAVNITDKECCIGRGLASIRSIEGTSEALFIFYALRIMEKDIESRGVGTTFKAINKNDLITLPIPIVAVEQQHSFVAFAEQLDKSKYMQIERVFTSQIGGEYCA